jgi:hypothetical protein
MVLVLQIVDSLVEVLFYLEAFGGGVMEDNSNHYGHDQ